jgi:hypothetical protein
MKSTLVNFDDIVNNVNDDWILKELLKQYRMIIHGGIDTLLKLRKRLRIKIPRDYLNLRRGSEKGDLNDSNADGDNARYPALYQYATRGFGSSRNNTDYPFRYDHLNPTQVAL